MEVTDRATYRTAKGDAGTRPKHRRRGYAAALVAMSLFAASTAQAYDGAGFSVRKWSARADRYADLVEVAGPGKTIFLWGTGAEDEASTTAWRPNIRHLGDFSGQCAYSLDKIRRMLAARGATFADVTTIRAFLTDGRHIDGLYACLDTVYAGPEIKPAVTAVNISQLAHPGMLVELEFTAVLPNKVKDAPFSIYRNSETLGKWNPGAVEILEVSGPDQTVYFSASEAVIQEAGRAPVALFPGQFLKQCDYLQRDLLNLLTSQGMAAANVVRHLRIIPGYTSISELMKCTPPPGQGTTGASTLLYVSQLGATGSMMGLDSLGMAALKPGQSATAFERRSVPATRTADAPGAVIVSGPRRTINIAGLGAQDSTGAIRFPGDFKAQCAASVERIAALLKARNASIKDIVKMLVFVTDSRHEPEFRACMAEAFPGAQPAQTFFNVARLPQPGMLIQIDATAVAAP